MIPEAAVEALARVLANEALFNADIGGYGWDSETDSSDHFMPNARKKALRYLEAAAPHMLAEAYSLGWRDGTGHPTPVNIETGDLLPGGKEPDYNPYRSQA